MQPTHLKALCIYSAAMQPRRQRPASASSKLGPPPNYLIEEARVREGRTKHVQAVAKVAAQIDNSEPEKPSFLVSRRPSKAQQGKAARRSGKISRYQHHLRAARAAEVKRDNAILVHKLHNIMHKPRDRTEPRTVNLYGTQRKLVTSKIARENNVRLVSGYFLVNRETCPCAANVSENRSSETILSQEQL